MGESLSSTASIFSIIGGRSGLNWKGKEGIGGRSFLGVQVLPTTPILPTTWFPLS
jgi:hypothetical protein